MTSFKLLFYQVFLLTAGLVSIQLHSQSPFVAPSKKANHIHTYMTRLYDKGLFTGSILVAEQGKVIYKNAFGLANREKNIPFTLNTPEYIGSISKPFTALGVMILKEQNKIGYHTPIREIFPALPTCFQPVTIKHLLQHTSGLAVFDDFPDMTSNDVFNILLKQTHLRFKPGAQFEYCNAGYSLLGMVIEKISGQSLHNFFSKAMFTPLAMNNTSVNEISNRNTQRAVGYDLYGTPNNYDTFMGGNASIISTVEDLFKWDQALYDPAFISQSTLHESLEDTLLILQDNIYGPKHYEFGWWVAKHNNRRTIFHDGAFGGYRAYIERFVDSKNTIIHISNLRHPLLLEMRIALTNILDDKPYDIPKTPISVWLMQQYQSHGIAQVEARYTDLKKSETGEYTFFESDLNSFGYYLLRKNMVNEALSVFKINASQYPTSANAHDSLGEAYLKVGQKDAAIQSYRKHSNLIREITMLEQYCIRWLIVD